MMALPPFGDNELSVSFSRSSLNFADPFDFYQNDIKPENVFVEKGELFTSDFIATKYEKLFSEAFVRFGPIANTIEAFNQVLFKIIPERLVTCIETDPSGTYSLTNIRVVKPVRDITITRNDGTSFRKTVPMFPRDARNLSQSYSATIYAEVTRTVHSGILRAAGSDSSSSSASSTSSFGGGGMKSVANFIIGSLPIMVGSAACHLHGYTKEELRAVGEDGTPIDRGYFILSGSERIVVNQETLAANQIISRYDDKSDIFETRITSQSRTGTTVVSVTLEKDWHIVKVSIQQKGMMGAETASYTVFAIFDALFQLMDPENLGYDEVLYPEQSASFSSERRMQIRNEIVRRTLEIIRLFVPVENQPLMDTFFVASTIEYLMSEWPVKSIVSERLAGAQFGESSLKAMLAAARRSAAAVVASGGAGDATTSVGVETIQHAARVAAEAAARISEAPSEYRIRALLIDLFKDLFSNMDENDFRMKAHLLARLVAQQMLVVSGIRPIDNRDSWANKRIKRPADVYAQTMNSYRLSISDQGFVKSSVHNVIDRIFSAALSPNSGRDSTVQSHIRITPLALPGQIATIGTPASKKSKQMGIRKVQSSQVGYVCAADTPTSDAIGLTKSLTTTCWTSLRRDDVKARKLISQSLMGRISDNQTRGSPHPIFVDGILMGWGQSEETATAIRQVLKKNIEFFDVTVVWRFDDRSIEIHTVGGRPTRPLLVLDEELGNPLIADAIPDGSPIEDYITSGAVEFVSAMEQSYARVIERIEDIPIEIEKRSKIAKDKRNYPLYSEINPVAILGVSTSLMPLANSSQGPRVTYQANMFKQCLGKFHDCAFDRHDHSSKRSPGSRPFVETLTSGPLGMQVSPCGRPLVIQFKAEGENEEDGIVANYEAFSNITITKYQSKKAITRRIGNMTSPAGHSTGPGNIPAASMHEIFGRPTDRKPVGGNRQALYHAIESNGFPKIGSIISKGDCIIGIIRIYLDASGNQISTEDASEFAGVGDEGVVDRVQVVQIDDDKLSAHVRLRQVRGVKPGEKLASRQSQKGTITKFLSNYTSTMPGPATSQEAIETRIRASATTNEGVLRETLAAEATASSTVARVEEVMASFRFASDLPIVATGPNRGVVPDLIINPASETSRMTACRLQELVSSKATLYSGQRKNLSAFVKYMDLYYENDRSILENEGLDGGAYETLMYPNGVRLHPSVRVFMGPLYFLFLKHTVMDKIQARNTGLKNHMTHQPIKGRSKGGGLRQGPMERSAFGSAGAADLLRTVMIYNSDVYEQEICTVCGKHATIANHKLGIYECMKCHASSENIGRHRVPAAKLLIDSLLEGAVIFSSMMDFREVTRAHDPI